MDGQRRQSARAISRVICGAPTKAIDTQVGGFITMKTTLSLTFILLALAASGLSWAEGGGAGTANRTEAAYGKQKVVYHINFYDAKHQTAALRNVQNHINAVGADNLDLDVVLHGDGVSLLLYPDALEGTRMKEANATDEMQARIAGLKQQGVTFSVCANTLKGRKVAEEDLYDLEEGDIVPSGVAELAHLQAQGYVYIKP
jgi:intracellular sulfur oxidation DsrE/DsrF family protein